MYNISFYIPRYYNNKKRIEEKKLKLIINDILQSTRGISYYKLTGKWINERRIYTDKNYIVNAIVENINYSLLDRIKSRVKKELRQLSAFITVTDIKII